jgi:hypothetical protein
MEIPSEDLLYHVVCEVIDYHKDKSGATRTTEVFGTYTSLLAAKSAARSCLKMLGYLPEEFSTYREKINPETWSYGDGVFIYAKAPAGQEFSVRVDTKPNENGFKGTEHGKVEGHLCYVLQTKIDYNDDRIGGKQTTEVEGVYRIRKDALDAAYTVLLDDAEGITKESFAEYDEQDMKNNDWPYGEEILVHAVGQNGDNFLVAVKSQLSQHEHEFKLQH